MLRPTDRPDHEAPAYSHVSDLGLGFRAVHFPKLGAVCQGGSTNNTNFSTWLFFYILDSHSKWHILVPCFRFQLEYN